MCHVLRYAPFYTVVKSLLDSGNFGKIIQVNMTEDIGYYHYAHSYVRGPWRNKKVSAPVILAKCCHDMDLFAWFIGKKCRILNSFGKLSFLIKSTRRKGQQKIVLIVLAKKTAFTVVSKYI